MPSRNGQPDRFISSPKAYAAKTPYAASIAISARPVTRRGSRPAPIPTQADTSIWNGSHGPTPAVISAEANSEVHAEHEAEARARRPGPARISRKKISSTPPVPARDAAQDRVDRAEHAEDREHPGVQAALAELGEHHRDHDRQQRAGRGTAGRRRLSGVTRTSSGQHEHHQPGRPRRRRGPAPSAGQRDRPDGVSTALIGAAPRPRPGGPTSSTRSHGGPSTLVTCGANAGDSATHPADRAGRDDLALGEHHARRRRPARRTRRRGWPPAPARPSSASPRRMPARPRLAA